MMDFEMFNFYIILGYIIGFIIIITAFILTGHLVWG